MAIVGSCPQLGRNPTLAIVRLNVEDDEIWNNRNSAEGKEMQKALIMAHIFTQYLQVQRFLLFAELLLMFISNFVVYSWPDGAPCIRSVMESMNPLEAVEHQGGLQLTEPPFRIEVDQKCYWRNQPVSFTLEGKTPRDKFKGFAIQPFSYQSKRRVGQFVRLDDNGSWQFQCFRNKDAITHSHDEGKKKMKMWWRSPDSEHETIQFVATVVISLKKFWVQSVVSAPIPPCRSRQEIGAWTPPLPTVPPPTDRFKLETFQFFNGDSAHIIANSISNSPNDHPRQQNHLQPAIQTIQSFTSTPAPFVPFLPATTIPPKRLNHIIPLGSLEFNHSPNTFQSSSSPVCRDMDSAQKCFSWIRFCTNSPYMRMFCQKTCQICR